MFGTLLQKELKAILLSPKFFATFAVCSILLLLSVYIGVREYRTAVAQYETAVGLADRQIHETASWYAVSHKAFRTPDPMQIFISGLSNDIGRWSEISSREPVKLKHSNYSDDPIYAVFRFIDFSFIVQVIFSLFAILFTYDAVSGEREAGTLRLVFSNAVARARYILAKCVGAWLGLVLPICIPILLSLLLVLLFGIPLTAGHWVKIAILIGMSLAFFTFFIVLGVLVSTVTRRSNVSFLIALVIWVIFVLIVPRAGVMAAGQMVTVPSVAEIEGRRDAYARDKWAGYQQEAEKRWLARNEEQSGNDEELDEEAMWARMEEEDSARRVVVHDIDEYGAKLQDDLRHRKAVQEKLAFSLSRFSPASAYQLAVMSLADTDIGLKSRNEEAMSTYRNEFNEYVENKSQGSHGGGVMISISSETGMQIGSREETALDLSDLPSFIQARRSLAETASQIIVDLGLLVLYTIIAFAGSFVAFLRYDVR